MTRMLKLFATLVTVLLIAFAAQPWAMRAHANSTANLENALADLARFQQEVTKMQTAARAPLGPYPFHTQCTWCSERAWWGFGLCTQESTETWNATVDFSWTRTMLDMALGIATRDARVLQSTYAPTQRWIDGLPAFSLKFDASADRVLAVQEQIHNGIGPNDAQRAIVTASLRELSEEMGRSTEQLDIGTRVLATSIEQLGSLRNQIRMAMDTAGSSANDALLHLEREAQSHRCQDGLSQKFAVIQGDFDRSMTTISAGFEQLDNSSRGAQAGMGALLGDVVSSRTQLQSVLDLINATSNDEMGSLLERLHLKAAKLQWHALADSQMKVSQQAAQSNGKR